MILMYDSTSGSAPPANAPAVAGYVDGFVSFPEMVRNYPHAKHLSITVRAGIADCLDWEPGTAQVDPAGWVLLRHSQGLFKPCVYADLSDMHAHVLPSLSRLARPSYRIWSAHPTGVEHICGPHTCGALPFDADATQFWFDSISGPFHGVGNVDVSVTRDDFFDSIVQPPPPPPEDYMAITAAELNGVPHVFVEAKDGSIWYTYQSQDPATPGPDRNWNGGKAGQQIAGLTHFAPAPK